VVTALDEIGPKGGSGGLQGCILANEVLDNFPFHRLWGGSNGPVELLVGLVGPRFVFVNGPAQDEVAKLAPSLAFGEETNVRPGAMDLIDVAASVLRRGYLWVIDYGSAAGSSPAHSYREQRVEADVLDSPGSRDITAGVDFGVLAAHAATRGISVWGPLTQREGLLALGFREWDARARDRQIELSAERRGVEAARAYSARSRASLLIDPAGLGAFLMLGLGVGVPQEATPRFATRVDRPPPAPHPFGR
jgi:NADH dehydrogenase [ubiquinone] 1 alpha subcomplex assembly factor 7